MKSFQQLARVAYEALGHEFTKQSGVETLSWEEIDPQLQASWVKAMQAVVAELESIH